jgi:hypothetical protein
MDRSGADVHAKTFAGTTAEDRSVHRSGAAPFDRFALGGPVEHALGAGITFDHALIVVERVLGQCLDRHQRTRLYAQHRRDGAVQISLMRGLF